MIKIRLEKMNYKYINVCVIISYTYVKIKLEFFSSWRDARVTLTNTPARYYRDFNINYPFNLQIIARSVSKTGQNSTLLFFLVNRVCYYARDYDETVILSSYIRRYKLQIKKNRVFKIISNHHFFVLLRYFV